MKPLYSRALRFASAAGLALFMSAAAEAGNLDASLSDLVNNLTLGNAALSAGAADPGTGLQIGTFSSAMLDDQGRILVDIYVAAGATIGQVSAQLAGLGANITGVNGFFQNGAISAYVPVGSIQAMSNINGVKQMNMTARPMKNVGAVTSQGAKVMRADVANANGYIGTGITVGVLSDSYNTAANTFTTIHAANDIATGDLPNPKFVTDDSSAATDEGRAMMQIVYDVAPNSSLCFATAELGEASFASNIRLLRTNPSCNADVIVDDVFYYDEPVFSDGQLAQAVNDVVTSTTLAGKQVAYFSSAGNFQSKAYTVNNAVFSSTPTGIGNINLASIAACGLVSPSSGNTAANATSFLDFGGGNFAPALSLSVGPNGTGTLLVQWDDLFYQGKVTTDLNFYIFNSSGNCAAAIASDNINTTDNGFERITLGLGPSGGTFNGRMMIGRTSAGTNLASNVRLLAISGWSSNLFSASQPATFGHASATNAVSVAAYVYSNVLGPPYVPAFESFSSPGPVQIFFDASGNRMTVPETRKKPDIAAPDGVDTTFFFPGSDYEGDGFPNFFGTSAAAPHAAGVAALMLQKAGGPTKLTAAQIKTYMQNMAPARVIPYSGGSPSKAWSFYDGYGLIDAVATLTRVVAH
jgi:hypothetical protein